MSKRLEGRRVVVTRAPDDADALGQALAAEGARPVYLATIARRPAPDAEAVARAARRLEGFDRVLCGSAAALAAFTELPPPESPAPLACVGAATADKVASDPALARWFRVAEVAETRRAEGLVAALVTALGREGRLDGRRFLFPRPPEGRETLVEALVERGAAVEAIETYRIACEDPASPEARGELDGADAFTFLSGRTLACFLTVVGEEEARARLARSTVAVIGPVAAEEAARRGIRVDVVPPTAAVGSLVEALAAHLESS